MVKSPLGILVFPFSNHSSTFTVSPQEGGQVKNTVFPMSKIVGVSSRFVGCVCVFCLLLKMGVHHKSRVTWENQP